MCICVCLSLYRSLQGAYSNLQGTSISKVRPVALSLSLSLSLSPSPSLHTQPYSSLQNV